MIIITRAIDKVVDGLDRLNEEEEVWACWFVGEGVAYYSRQVHN